MATIRLTGHIDESGRLELDQTDVLPPGDVIVTIESISPEDEVASDARWDASFAKSEDLLARMAAKVRKNREQGLNPELILRTL